MTIKLRKKWPVVVLVTCSLFLPHTVFASLTSQNTKIVTSEKADTHQDETLVFMGKLSPDGTANVQVASDGQTVKRLLLVNNPILNRGVKAKPAQVTVIHNTSAKPLSIRDVEVLGPASDIVIASPAGLICDSCQFTNAKRVVLTTGSPIFNNGNLASTKTKQGLLEIIGSGLRTQDAVFVDLLADRMNINADINTFARVNKNSAGQYEVAPDSGKFMASQGNLQMITGLTSMDYHTASVTINNAKQLPRSLQINGNIDSGSVFIQSTGLNTQINIQGNLNTSGDVSLVDSYRGNHIIPNGNIHIKSFSQFSMRENTAQTQSNVYLESENITIQPNEHYKEYSIKAGNIEISAEKSYISSGLIYAENIKIAANKIVHSGGEAFALDSLYVNGITSIQNSHQGIFVGSNVALTSQNTIINGIFKPWNCQKPRSSSQFGSNVHHPKDEIEIGSGKGIIKDFINTCKGSALLTDWSKSQRTASIFGFNLSLSAPEIINSNPYIKQRKEYKDPTVNMQITDSNTVSISAENAMVIHAKNALKNGSGVIEVLNGNMSINAPSINNQRYFIHAKTHTKHVKKPLPHICTENGFWEWMVDMGYDDVMAPIDYPEMHEEVRDIKSKCSKIKNTTDIIDEQYISALSPVGRMLVAGNLILNGNKILNEASNFEIWGKMNGSLKEIKSLGLVLKEKIVQQQITQHEKRYCSRRVFGACLKRKTERWTTTSHQLIKHDVTAQFPALFDINKANINVANGKITTGNITFGK